MKFNSIIPELAVKDLQVSKNFYLDILGFVLEYERIENNFIFISYGEAQIMIEQINGYWETGKMEHPFGRGINFQIDCSNAEKLSNKLISNGYRLFEDVYEVNYKENEIEHRKKEFLVQDPDGYLLRFSQSI